MELIRRSLYRSHHIREAFFRTTCASAMRHNSNKSALVSNAVLAGTGKGCASRFTSALLDTARGMASENLNMDERLVWLDMEMTGLDVDTCHIIEIACLVTDSDLEVVSDDFHVVIHQPDDVLVSMNAWCVEQHGKTGLTAASRESKISLKEAEELCLKFLADNVPENKCPIAGNSVWMDRIFLRKYMPLVDNYAHYRIIDVSSVKELVRRWCPKEYSATPSKQFNHRALDDIRESISELKYYKSKIFNR